MSDPKMWPIFILSIHLASAAAFEYPSTYFALSIHRGWAQNEMMELSVRRYRCAAVKPYSVYDDRHSFV